ncbi:MAG: CHASE2 domain-containing protein [Opitutales bacterium]
MQKKGRVRKGTWWALGALPLMWGLFTALHWTQFLDDEVLGWMLQARGEIEAPVKVMYVDVDSRAAELFGSPPWHRGIYALVAEALLDRGGAKAVGIDFVFSEYGQEAAREGNPQVRRVSDKFPGQLVLAATYSTNFGPVRDQRSFPFRYLDYRDPDANDLPELPEFAVTGLQARVGLIDVLERGGIPHEAPMFAEARGARYLNFALQLALIHWGVGPEGIRIDAGYKSMEIVDASGDLVAAIPLLREQLVEINWHSPWLSDKNPRQSVAEVARNISHLRGGTPEEQAEAETFFAAFEDAIVLIGPVEALLGDLTTTPFDPLAVPRVSVHGNLVKTLVGENFHRRLPAVLDVFFVVLLGIVVIPAMAFDGKAGTILRGGAGAMILLYIGGCVWLFVTQHWVLPLAAPFLAAVTTASVGAVLRGKAAERQKKRVEGLFGSYLAPEMVKRLVAADEEPRLGGEEVEITAFFSDAERFSTFSEKLSPPKMVSLMNEYLSALTGILMEEKATLDKYIGDAIVAFFGSPIRLENHAWLACRAAVRVQKQQEVLCRKWLSEGESWPVEVTRMRTRIGLSTGMAVTGNMGSQRHFNYTMMGDIVNVGARLEQMGKEMGTRVLVTGETRRQAEHFQADFLFRSLGLMAVSGRAQEVEVHELMGMKDEASAGEMSCIQTFEQAHGHYLEGRWKEAEALFAEALELEPEGAERMSPSSVFLARCRERAKTGL